MCPERLRRLSVPGAALGVALLSASRRASLALQAPPVPHVRLRAEGEGSSLTGALGSTELWLPDPTPLREEAVPPAFSMDKVLALVSRGEAKRAAQWLDGLMARGVMQKESALRCYGSVAVAFARQGEALAALRRLRKGAELGRVEAEVFRDALGAFAKSRPGPDESSSPVQGCLALLEQMQKEGHRPDVACCNAVLRSLGLRQGAPATAASWMENEMPLLGVEPDDESVEILVEAFFRQGLRKGAATWLARLRGKPSEDLLGVMREKLKETEEDVLQYWLGQPKLAGLRRSRGLVRRLLQLSEVAQAEAWLERCLADGFEPDRLCFTDLAREWLQQGEPKRAALWLDRMVAEGLLPSREVTALVLAAGLEADASDSEKAEGDATQRVLRLAQSGRASEDDDLLQEASQSLAEDGALETEADGHLQGGQQDEDEDEDEPSLVSQDESESASKFCDGRRRRSRRRRRQDNTLDKKCWYQLFQHSLYQGTWLNYELGGSLCDDLEAYNTGAFNNMFSSGLMGAAPGCKLELHDSHDCTDSSPLKTIDATSKSNPVVKNMNQFDNFHDKISGVKCTC